MSRVIVSIGVSEAKEAVIIQTQADGTPLAHAILDASELDKLIRRLGQARAALNEKIVDELDIGSRIEAEFHPGWRVPDTYSIPG